MLQSSPLRAVKEEGEDQVEGEDQRSREQGGEGRREHLCRGASGPARIGSSG